MKSTGIVRKVDMLGRIVVPKELRTSLNIEVNDPVEIYTEGDMVVLKKYQASEEKKSIVQDLQTLLDNTSEAHKKEILERVKEYIGE
ncbi:AbrB/MazE/SpoVT family DNA-binding domain-containing protein [Halobacillus massiliensis]|uniref:AbrB/MazE/SpoVT family DNA-binding domain-containing protein n=1 Tax=Halobacillus massiliensis TaxID=1926286 RepID=UPI0009E53239|nr:AbrB/MazE/SpoVT family DNA-binding domain-containing protein [Halobacillus massiliensis]